MDGIRVENHFARNDSDHVELGTTSLGTRVRLDKRLVEADLKIAVGLVDPHFMAGYSGGPKLIMLGCALAVNSFINEEWRVAFLDLGEIVQSPLEAMEFIRSYVEIEVPKTFRTVLTGAGGYPLDRTYYQKVKGMVAAKDILAPGGDLFIVSDISEGMGSIHYLAAQRSLVELGLEGFYKSIRAITESCV